MFWRKIFLIFSILASCPVLILATDRVEINTASLQQLDELTGIGPVLAQRIIDARPFSSVDDLLRVKGIGEKTLQKIKDQRLAYVEGQAQQSSTPAPSPTQSSPQMQQNPNGQIPSLNAPEVRPLEIKNQGETRSSPTEPLSSYPDGVVFNEILPSPEGPDDKEEWIEIFNQNNFEVDISGWKIQDEAGKTTVYTFPGGTKIGSQSYLVVRRPETKITLNNDEDGLKLFQPNGNIIDSVDFEKAPRAQSYNKTISGWVWSPNLTPGSTNIAPEKEKTEVRPLTTESKGEQNPAEAGPRGTQRDDEGQKAAIGERMAKSGHSLPFVIAIIIAIFSTILIFSLKRFLTTKSGD